MSILRGRWTMVVGARRALFAGLVVLGVAVPSAALADQQDFSATGAEQTFTVPDGVYSITANVLGAAGGGNAHSAGGAGAAVQATLSVSPGEQLYVEVGKAGVSGDGGWPNGGNGVYGGGGSSDIRTCSMSDGTCNSLDSRVIVAGGGGGAGGDGADPFGTFSFYGAAGGAGGSDGSNGFYSESFGYQPQGGFGGHTPVGAFNGTGGGGGAAAASDPSGFNGVAGSDGVYGAGGSAGSSKPNRGGGGGGGYYGGGAGGGGGIDSNGAWASGGGGGGGSSYWINGFQGAPSAGTDGSVSIIWTPPGGPSATLGTPIIHSYNAEATGTLNSQLATVTDCEFDYGPTPDLGSRAFCAQENSASETDVSALLQRLRPGTTYYYQLVVTTTYGTTNTSISTLTTASASPSVRGGSADGISKSAATLHAIVNPNAAATSAYFQIGTTTGYGAKTTAKLIPLGGADVPVAIPVSSLLPDTLYHARVVAVNADGTAHGQDFTFRTKAAQAPPRPVCVVPRLKGETVTKARKTLGVAHCTLGTVSRPKHIRRHAKLVVSRQTPAPGTRLPNGARVNVVLAGKGGR
jgi:hypothetical protein